MEIYGQHYGGPASVIWCERCRRVGHEAKMCTAREPRRFHGLCDTCCWLGHLSCDCLLQRDRIYYEVPTLSSPPISPLSYSGRSGGPGYDIPCSPPQYSGSHCYRAKPFVRRYNGGHSTAPPQQPAPRPFSSFVRDQRYNGGHRTAPPQQLAPRPSSSFVRDQRYNDSHSAAPPPQQPAPRPFSSFVRDQRYNGGHSAASPQQPAPRPFSSFVRDQRYSGGHSTAPQQQPRPRPFCRFGWEQRGACRDGPPVNGRTNSIAQGQAQRDVEMDCHGGPVSKVSGPPETNTPLARGGLPLQARRQRRLQPPSGTLSPPTVVISDSAFEECPQSDNMEMQMFSQSEGPQQLAPTAVTLAAVAPAAEAVTGTRVFPAVSPKGVAEAPASSAGAALAAVPAAAPATGGTVFPTASVGGAVRAPASADGIAALTAAPATGSTAFFAASVGGAPASSAVAAASAEISAAEPATSGNDPSAAPIRGAVGARESSTGAVSSEAATEAAPSTGGTAAPAASTAREARALASAAGSAGEICGKKGASTHPFDSGTVFPLEVRHSSDERARHNSSSGDSSSSSSSNDNTNDHDSWWDATCVGALLRPFDPGKRCRRSTRRGKAVLGVDLPFDCGKAWGRMQHGG